MVYRVFVQARMSSRRFPGKMLSLAAGRPLIDWVLERIALAVESERITIATSTDCSDDPLADHVKALGYQVFRGELDNVAARFQACLREYPADWLVRICGDSPLLDPGLISGLARHCCPELDLVTNVQERTFPPGQSVEFINARTYEGIDTGSLSPMECEHLTQVFYRNSGRYRVRNIAGSDPSWRHQSYVVDTRADLEALEPRLRAGQFPVFAGATSIEAA